jgi:hypothetical protein
LRLAKATANAEQLDQGLTVSPGSTTPPIPGNRRRCLRLGGTQAPTAAPPAGQHRSGYEPDEERALSGVPRIRREAKDDAEQPTGHQDIAHVVHAVIGLWRRWGFERRVGHVVIRRAPERWSIGPTSGARPLTADSTAGASALRRGRIGLDVELPLFAVGFVAHPNPRAAGRQSLASPAGRRPPIPPRP